MTIKINFDAAHNPEEPTFVLARRNGDKLGKINAKAIEVVGSLNDASEITFNVYKYIDGEKDLLWDKIVDFKLVYCVEWNKWFECTVEIDEKVETVKTVFCMQLGQAELSQTMLYDIEINTEDDIEREDYTLPTVLFRDVKNAEDAKKKEYRNASLMHRILEKAPHYSIRYINGKPDVDETIMNMQRTFTFDDTSIYDACQEIAEELNCLFVFNSDSDENGNIQRTISIYDLESNCLNPNCRYRGDFIGVCPECGSTDGENIYEVDDGYGEDTAIFVTADEIADNIQLTTDTGSIKNCFKLEAGDDLMTATIKNCNPNGSDYIWYLSDDMKEDMSDSLIAKIDEYNKLYEQYQTDEIELDDELLSDYNALVDKYNTLMKLDEDDKFENVEKPINGFPNLINAYYNTFDLHLYLQSGLMPTVDTARPSIEDEIAELTAANLSPVAVNVSSVSSNPLKAASVSTVDNLVLAMAKTLVDSRYKVKIADGSKLSDYEDGVSKRTWQGKITLTAYSDDEVTATTNLIEVEVNDDYETFVRRKIDKTLSSGDVEDLSISSLLKKNLLADLEDGETEEDSFEYALKEYSLNRLISFHDACQSCIDIMIEMGVADGETWGNVDYADLYGDLYTPYYNKLTAIQAEMNIRDAEIAIVSGVYDEDGDVISAGLQTIIEDKKSEIQDALDFEAFLGEELWLEFCSFRREDKYSNDNYISDGLSNAELIAKASEFIETANKEIYKSAELQCSISADLNNLLVIDKFKPLIEDFRVGNWLRVMVDDKLYKLRLISYTIDYDNLDGISVEFSDTTKVNSTVKSVQEVLSQASSMATSYVSVQRQASQGEESKTVINNWFDTGLDATNVKIVGGADGQSQTWDNHGMLFREYDESTGEYLPEQLKIINSTMSITDDNWKTTKTAVGKYYYTDIETGELKMAYGVNAETIIGKLIIGENLAFSNNSSNMTFDENGLVVKNDVNVVSINPNDESIFNIKSNGSNILNFDESGNLVIVGNIYPINSIESEKVTGLADVAISGSYNDLSDKPELAKVATTGSYNDLADRPELNLSKVATSGSYNDLADKPSLATVATSGSYDDLSDKPSFNNVAYSGNYTDLAGDISDAGKLLYVGVDGSVTSISISDLKALLEA